MRTWIKNPLAMLAEGAGGGIVVEDGRIVELVATGRAPSAPVKMTFDGGGQGIADAHPELARAKNEPGALRDGDAVAVAPKWRAHSGRVEWKLHGTSGGR